MEKVERLEKENNENMMVQATKRRRVMVWKKAVEAHDAQKKKSSILTENLKKKVKNGRKVLASKMKELWVFGGLFWSYLQ